MSAITFDALADESGGVMSVYVINRDDLPSLVAATMRGDVRSAQLLRSVLKSIDVVESAPKRQPVPCGCCLGPVRQRSGYAIGVALPDVDVPSRGVGFALCRYCCSTDATANAAAIRAIKDVMPNARPIVITHQDGGHA